jgi:biopolymer transport protein ExbD
MKLQGRNKVNPEFSMSSMTDIVFLLLIFFMLTANALDLLLPKAKGQSTNTQSVTVSIDGSLMYYVNQEAVAKESLPGALSAALEGQSDPTILLRAEESVAIKEAVYVMDLAQRNKYKVILAVRPQ